LVIVDGVGYPSVGSICNVSNGHVARALRAPVLLVGKSGVGDAVDSFNLNAAYFESFGVQVLGGIFNKISLDGFYNVQACKEAVTSYFRQFKSWQMPYGFVPIMSVDEENQEDSIPRWTEAFMQHVDLVRLIHDAWLSQVQSPSFPYAVFLVLYTLILCCLCFLLTKTPPPMTTTTLLP
jgi:cobyrinic acid a,c-diamide synthase